MAINWDDIPVYDPTQEDDDANQLVEFAPSGFNEGGLSISPRDLETPTALGEVKKGLVRGSYELGAMGAGLVGLAGDAVGADSVADWGVDKYKELEGKAAESAANVQNFDEIHGLGDAGLYAAGVLGEQLPILIPALASGGAGGLAARALGRRVIADQVAKKVAEGVAQDVAEKEVADLVASEAYKKAAQKSIERGAEAGAFAGNYGMIAGGSFGQIADETGEKDAGAAAAFAVPGAALETLFDVYLGKKLLGPLMGAEGTRAPGVSGFLGNAAKVAAEGAAIEAPTEYLQTGLEQAAVGAADPNRTVGDVVFSPQSELERERAAVAGATAGLGFGAGAGVVNSAFTQSLTPKTDQELQKISFKQNEAPDGGTVVDPEVFHDPVSINEGDREHTLVQSKVNGQWFLTNPGEEFDGIPKTGPTASWVAINPEVLSRRDTIGAALVERANATLNDKLEGVSRDSGNEEDTNKEDTEEDETNLEPYDPDKALRKSPQGAELLKRDLRGQQPRMGRAELSARTIIAKSDPAEGDRLAAINDERNAQIEAENQRIAALGSLTPGSRINYRLPGGEENSGELFVSGYDEQGNLIANSVDVTRIETLKDKIENDQELNSLKAASEQALEKLNEAKDQLDSAVSYSEELKNTARDLSYDDKLTAKIVSASEKNVASARKRFDDADAAHRQAVLQYEENSRRVSLLNELRSEEEKAKENKTFVIPKQNLGQVSTLGAPLNQDKNLAQSPLGAELLRQELARQQEEQERRNLPKRRNPEEAKAFADSLEQGDAITYYPEDGDPVNATVAGRRPNGSLVLATGKKSFLDVSKQNFSRLGLQKPKAKLRNVNTAVASILGNNPTTQSIQEAGFRKVEGKNGTYDTELDDGLGSEKLPIQVNLYRRKGDQNNLVVRSKGVFTNNPRTTLRQMNRGLAIEVPEESLSALHPDIQVETYKGKNIVTAVSDKTYVGDTKVLNLKNMTDEQIMAPGFWASRDLTDSVIVAPDEKTGAAAFSDLTPELALQLKNSGRVTVDVVDAKQVTTRTMRRAKTDPTNIRFDSPLTLRGSGNKRIGIGAADDVLKNDARFAQKSEAGMMGARVKAGQSAILSENIENPITEKLKGIFARLGQLDEIDNEIYQSAISRIQDYLKGSNVSAEVLDYATTASINDVAEQMLKSRGYTFDKKKNDWVLPRGAAPAARFTAQGRSELNRAFLEALGQAREKRSKEMPAKIRKAIEKIEADETKQNDKVKDRDGSVDAMTAAQKEKAAIYAIERGDDAILRDAVKIAGQGRSAAEKRALESIKNRYKTGGKINPITLVSKNIIDAKRTLARRANLIEKQSIDKPYERAPQSPAEANAGIAASKLQDTLGVTPAAENIDTPFSKEEWIEKSMDSLTPEDREILLRAEGYSENPKKLTQKEKQRYGQLKRYIKSGGRGPDSGYPGVGRSAAQIPLSEFGSSERLSGVMESRARRTEAGDSQREAGSMGATSGGEAGTVQETAVQGNGRSGVGAFNAARTRQLGESARRRFVQSFARLTDEEAAAISREEVDALTEAITSRYDEAAAKASNTAISGTAVPAEDLVGRGASELVSRYAEGLREQEANKSSVARMRENARRLVLAGAFRSQTEFLNRVALGNYPQDMKLRAKAMLSVGARGFNFNDLAVQIGRFETAEGGDTSWAGIISEDGRDIAINLDSNHDRGDIVQTYLHELGHALTVAKIDRKITLNPIEERALGRLEAIRQDAVIRAARRENISVPENPSPADIARLSSELYELSGDKRELGGLRNLKEFAVEVSGSPDLAALMADLGFGGKDESAGSLRSMVRAVKDAWNALVSLVSGKTIDPTSPLARAFTDSWIVNFGGEAAGGSKGTVATFAKSPLRETLGRLRDQGSWITAQIDERGLAGTAEDRNRLAAEYRKQLVAKVETAPITAEEIPTASDRAEDIPDVGSAGAEPINPFETDENGELVYAQNSEPVRDALETGDLSWMGLQSRAPNRVSDYTKENGEAGSKLISEVNARPEMFTFPRKLSESRDLKTVLDSTGASFSTFNALDKTMVSETPTEGEAVWFPWNKGPGLDTMDEGIASKVSGGRIIVVPPKGKSFADGSTAAKEFPANQVVKETHFTIQPEDDGKVSINSAGGGERTANLYQGIYQWAHNSGLKVLPDSGGTSSIGNYRRNAHQLSSALRTGASDYFEPTDDQLGRMFGGAYSEEQYLERAKKIAKDFGFADAAIDPEDGGLWFVEQGGGFVDTDMLPERARMELYKSGDGIYRHAWDTSTHEQRVGALMRAEVSYIERALPELVSFEYDPSTGHFRDLLTQERIYADEIGRRLDRLSEESEAQGDQAGIFGRVGVKSSRRYLASKSLLQGQTGFTRVPSDSGYDRQPLDGTLYSKAPKVNWKPLVKTTYTGGTYVTPGKLSVDNKLDPRAGERFRVRGREIAAANNKAEYWAKELNSRIKRTYKKGDAPLEQMNTALGSIENPLTRAQIEAIEAVKDSAKRSDLRDQYLRENREAFRVKQKEALDALPSDIAEAIGEMNAQITELSRILKDENIIGESLEATVDANLGIYLNRSYEIFDNPEWVDRVRKNETIIGNARKYIRDILVKNKAAKLMDESKTALSKAEAMRQAGDMVTPEDVERSLENYLAVADDAPSIQVLAGRVPGQKNISILTERGTIAPEIQELWGVRKDPSANYANTFNKMSALIANDRFLKDLKDMGLKEGWLYDPEDEEVKKDPDARIPRGFSRIAAEGNKRLAPLNGVYAMPELARALTEMFPADATENQAAWLNLAMKATGISMASKTVWSATSQVRNGLSNILNLAAAGNLSLGDLASGKAFERAGFAKDLIMADSFGRYKADPKAWRAEIEDMIRRGVLGESVTGNLLEELMDMNRAAEKGTLPETLFQKITAPVKAASDFAQKTYKAGDDLFKVMHYLAELEKYRKAFPMMAEEDLKNLAAKNSRDIHWTYSMAPDVVKDIKKFPFVAPFITFTTEVIRTSINLGRLAHSEITEGRKTGNKELEKIGWQRARGMATAALLPGAVASSVMAMAGISGDDEDDLRRFLPDWQKNNQLLMFKKQNGEVSFVDISYLDPYTYLKKPVVALMRSLHNPENAQQVLVDGALGAAKEALSPFMSEQIFAGAIMDVMRNRDSSGRQVYNPQDSSASIAASVAGKLIYDPFVPGTVTSLGRVYKAATNQTSESGRDYSLGNELASLVAGQRVSAVDAQQALAFKAATFGREMRDASALFGKQFTGRGTRSEQDVISGYAKANEAHMELIDNLRKDYLASIRLGLTPQQATSVLKNARVGDDILRMVKSGVYKRYEASTAASNLAKTRPDKTRMAGYSAALKQTPRTQTLSKR